MDKSHLYNKNRIEKNKKRIEGLKKKQHERLKKLKLTEKQKLFCQYYIKNFNATLSYLKAYNCTYNTAHVEGSKNLSKPSIKREVDRLKKLKSNNLMLSENDILEKYMNIAFADMKDFAEWEKKEEIVLGQTGPVKVYNKETGIKEYLKQTVTKVNFKDSKFVDGGLVKEIKQGKDGTSFKLEDRTKALEWLSNFFEMNPQSKHKKEYDNKKLELEERKIKSELENEDNKESINEFLEATKATKQDLKDIFDSEE